MPLDDPLSITVIVVVVVAACLLILYAMRGRGKRKEKVPEGEKLQTGSRGLPFKIDKSITSNQAGRAKDELRILELEREIEGVKYLRLLL